MLEFQKKRKIRNVFYSKLVLVVILVFLFIFIKATWKFYDKANESRHRKENVEHEMAELVQRKTELEQEIAHLDSSVGMEEELRTRFDLVKEGEETILLVDENKDATASEATTTKDGFWHNLWQSVNFWSK